MDIIFLMQYVLETKRKKFISTWLSAKMAASIKFKSPLEHLKISSQLYTWFISICFYCRSNFFIEFDSSLFLNTFWVTPLLSADQTSPAINLCIPAHEASVARGRPDLSPAYTCIGRHLSTKWPICPHFYILQKSGSLDRCCW